MQNGKKLFALLGGIFLMTSGTLFLAWYTIQIVKSSSSSVAIYALWLQISILIALTGLFLLLRKTTPSGIMILIAALFCLVNYITPIANVIRYGSNVIWLGVYLLNIASYILFGIGLFGKKTPAFVMCLIAAGLRFTSFVISRIMSRGFASLALLSILATLLLVAGMVMAALFKMSAREAEPQSWGGAAPDWSYLAAQQWNNSDPRQQNGSGGWKPYP